METHYFQRYHSKENVDTANAMLLLSRLYLNSPKSFFSFLNNLVEDIDIDVELKVVFQEKNKSSVPDAAIMQESFKIAVETKLHNNFAEKQLLHHLASLEGYNYKFLMTLDPREMESNLKQKINSECKNKNVIHINLTFKKLIEAVKEVVDDRDIDMQNIIDDYERYCYDSDLIPDDWKRMRVVLSGTSFESNKANNLYSHESSRGYSPHTYIGLYTDKSVRAIGKINSIFDAALKNNKAQFAKKSIQGTLTDDIKKRIESALIANNEEGKWLRFFIVDKFYDTDFKKITPRAPMGSRMFDLVDEINKIMPDGSKIEELPETSKIAELLKNCTWG